MRKSTHTSEYKQLRGRLTALRVNAGLSQRELAATLGVPHSWVAKVESGERRIDLIEFGWFCTACGSAPAVQAKRHFDQSTPQHAASARQEARR